MHVVLVNSILIIGVVVSNSSVAVPCLRSNSVMCDVDLPSHVYGGCYCENCFYGDMGSHDLPSEGIAYKPFLGFITIKEASDMPF